jgi:hypothetical protein
MTAASKHPWWLTLARIGHSVGVGIGVVAGVSVFLPTPMSVAFGAVASLATVVTHYADKGVANG